MRLVAVTQRVDVLVDRGERRDAIDQRWYGFLRECGFTPLLLPNNLLDAVSLLETIPTAGVVLTGGNDIAQLGGDAPERDELEVYLLEQALEGKFPLIGVCRGMQLIQHRFGVELEKVEGHVTPRQVINVDGSDYTVNSYHTWGARGTIDELEPWAVSKDGVIKAVRHRQAPILAVMWHPERMEPFAGTDLDLFRNHFTASFHHQEKSLDAQGTVYWITGLSGSGKTTIGEMFTRELKRLGRPTAFLDGDEIRNVLGNDIGHSADDRRISAMRNSRLCRMIAKQGVDVVCGTISMFHECRQWNRANIQNYREIYLKVPMEVLRKRDPKQIYSRTDRGEMKNVYGIDLKWDEPDSSDVTITNDGSTTPESVVAQLLSELVDKSQMQR